MNYQLMKHQNCVIGLTNSIIARIVTIFIQEISKVPVQSAEKEPLVKDHPITSIRTGNARVVGGEIPNRSFGVITHDQ